MEPKKIMVNQVLNKLDKVTDKLQTKLRKSKLKAAIHKIQVERGR